MASERAGETPSASPILVFCGDRYHPGGVVMSGLGLAGGGGFAFEQAPDGALVRLDPGIEAIVLAKMNVCSPTDETPWADAASGGLIQGFIERGGGLLVVHAGTAGYREAEAIRRVTGGAFLQHPEACQVTYAPVTGHRFCEGVESFEVRDEHYFVEIDPGQEVFLNANSLHGEQPAGWRSSFGKGRVCVVTPGHFPAVWAERGFRQLLNKGLKWVAFG